MRTAGLLASLILTSSLSVAHAQSKSFFVEVGVSSGKSDYRLQRNSEGRIGPAWSVALGREKELNPDVDVLWSVRYSLMSDRAWAIAPIQMRSQMTQHYVALGMLLAFDARFVKVLFGPELGYLVDARFDFECPPSTIRACTAEGVDPVDLFTRRNMMVSVGLGKEWRLGGQEMYTQLMFGQSLSSARDGRTYLAGYNGAYVLRTGVRF